MAPAVVASGPRPTNGMAIAAIICTFVCSPAGLVLGIIAKNQIKETGDGGEGLASAAIIVSSIFLALSIIFVIVFVAIFAVAVSHSSGTSGGFGPGAVLSARGVLGP